MLGLSLYILSQVLGSTLALQYMRSEYVAPLGSTSLIFNFLFARWLLGTKITILDAAGTLVVILGVVGVIGFGNIRQAGIDEEANMSLSTLETLWARPPWIFHLIALELITCLILWLASIGYEVIEEKKMFEVSPTHREDGDVDVEMVLRRGGGRTISRNGLCHLFKFLSPILNFRRKIRIWIKLSIESWSVSRSDQAMMKLDGLLWGCSAGLLAGQTLIFAKSYVKLVSNGLDHQGRGELKDLGHPLSILILILLVLTGVSQVWCLNRGLKVYDSTLIVPVLFATYTGSGFINSLVYLHELPHYRTTVLLMIWLCMGVLVIGVCMLSAKRVESGPPSKPIGEYSSSADPEGEVQPTAFGSNESVGMVMIDQSKLFKKRTSTQPSLAGSPRVHPPIYDQSSRSRSRSTSSSNSSSVIESKEDNPHSISKSMMDSTKLVEYQPSEFRTRNVSISQTLSNHSSDRSCTLKSKPDSLPNRSNPFDDFEILGDEELPEERDEDDDDEIDRLPEDRTYLSHHLSRQDHDPHAYARRTSHHHDHHQNHRPS